jgi:hypothetical protein
MNDDYKAVDGILAQIMCFCAIIYTLNRIGRHDWLMLFFSFNLVCPKCTVGQEGIECLVNGEGILAYGKLCTCFLQICRWLWYYNS